MDEICKDVMIHKEKIGFVDQRMQTILFGCDINSAQAIVEQLVEDFDLETLMDEREKLFESSKERLKVILGEKTVLDDQHRLECRIIKRKGQNVCKSNAKDIVELFLYTMGLSDCCGRRLLR